MNSNPTKAPVENGKGNMKVTTQTLGIANERVRDLTGYVLNTKEITTAVVKFLMCYGIDADDIRCVRVGSTINDKEPKIYVEIRERAFVKEQKKRNDDNFMVFESYSTEKKKIAIPDFFYSAWHNKIYHGKKKKLNVREVKYAKGDKTIRYFSIEISPEIFLAFVYDINYSDAFYRISAVPRRYKSAKELDDMRGGERKAYKRNFNDYKNLGLTQSEMFVITFSSDSTYKTPSGEIVTGFHPNQVDDDFRGRKDD